VIELPKKNHTTGKVVRGKTPKPNVRLGKGSGYSHAQKRAHQNSDAFLSGLGRWFRGEK
jgi:hypothetical protein